jgi:cupin 2 domain-containing protein
MSVKNVRADIPLELSSELVDVFAESDQVRIERIVSRGHTSPPDFWYDQDRAEWVLVIAGRGRLIFEHRPEPVELGPGDHILIAPHVRHRVVFTDPDHDTIWVAVHFN